MSNTESASNGNLLCYKCNRYQENEHQIVILDMSGRGYGSSYDNAWMKIQLCKRCNKPEYQMWFDESPEINAFTEHYKYEECIEELIKSFPIENQEYVLNDYMERYHWIKMQYGTLEDEVYEEYGMYSPRQIKAYEQRFPTCEHPVNKLYNDGSKGCWCPFGANGDYGQKSSSNVSTECFTCEQYKIRESPLKEMPVDLFDKYKKYVNAKIHIEKYKDLFE